MLRLVDVALTRPRRVAVVAVVVVVLAVVGLTQLHTSAATSTIVGGSSAAAKADRVAAKHFGGETVVVLVREGADQLTRSGDLQRLAGLEGCLAGTTGRGQEPVGGSDGPCGRLRDLGAAKTVYGPATMVQSLISAITGRIQGAIQGAQGQIAAAQQRAQAVAQQRGASAAEAQRIGQAAGNQVVNSLVQQAQVASGYGIDIRNPPTLATTNIVRRLVFTPGATVPRPRFAAVFPGPGVSLVVVRLREGLGDADRSKVVRLVDDAVDMPEWQLSASSGYEVTGTPVVAEAVATEIEHAVLLLLLVGTVVMAIVLALTFPERRRLRPLVLALATLGVTFGGIGLLGAPLTLGTIATLPVLLGLAVDYGVQLHARIEEEAREGRTGPDGIRAAVRRGGRPILLAAGATLAGFVSLLASPIPLVRGFGIVLAVGVALAVLASFTVGLTLRTIGVGRRRASAPVAASATAPVSAMSRIPAPLGSGGGTLGAASPVGTTPGTIPGPGGSGRDGVPPAPGAGRTRTGPVGGPAGTVALRARALSGGVARVAAAAGRPLRRPAGRVASALGRAAVVAGRALRTATRPVREAVDGLPVARVGTGPVVPRLVGVAYRRPVAVLVAGALVAVVGLVLGARTPVETDIRRLVPSDLPAIRSLAAVEREAGVSAELQVLVRGDDVTSPAALRWMQQVRDGVLAGSGYRAATGCEAATVCPLSSPVDLAPDASARSTTDEIRRQTALVPAYLRRASLTADRRIGLLSFGTRLAPLADQRRLVERAKRAAADPPPGITATVTGVPALVTDAGSALESSTRRILTILATLLLVALVLVPATRGGRRRGAARLVPVAYAAGWAGLVAWAVHEPLNPLSVVLGALVVAIGTEFSVLLAERYDQERAAGVAGPAAIARTVRSTGGAVGASAATAVAGFAVLAVSDIPLLRQFGLLTVVDLLVAILAVVLVLPALAALGDRRARGSRT